MKEYDLQKLINNPAIVDDKIKELMEKKLLFKQDIDREDPVTLNAIKEIIIKGGERFIYH